MTKVLPNGDTICDDYAVKTQEEVDEILKNLKDLYIKHLKRKMLEKNSLSDEEEIL